MEKLTINRLGPPRNKSGVSSKTGKPYSFNEIGFQTNEHGEKWFSFTYNGDNPGIEVGRSYELEVTDREYNGKTYYTASFPKKQQGGIAPEQWALLIRKLDDILTQIKVLQGKGKSWTPTIADADFTPVEDTREVPAEVYDDEQWTP